MYKDCVQDESMITVKCLKDNNDVPQFNKELEMIRLTTHKSLLRLIGCCTTSTKLILVYPYMTNASVVS